MEKDESTQRKKSRGKGKKEERREEGSKELPEHVNERCYWRKSRLSHSSRILPLHD